MNYAKDYSNFGYHFTMYRNSNSSQKCLRGKIKLYHQIQLEQLVKYPQDLLPTLAFSQDKVTIFIITFLF